MPKKQVPSTRMPYDQKLDRVDRLLLVQLGQNARLTLAELGRRVGLSAPAVGERLQRLEARGVVRGYTTHLDPRALGYPLSAVIRIRPAATQLQRVAELAQQTLEVVECYRITGDDCYLMKLHLKDVDHLERVLDRFTPFGQTTTSIIQSSPVPTRGVAIETSGPVPTRRKPVR